MSKEAVAIKGTRQGLIICLDPDCNYEELKISLIDKMESAQGFFNGAKFALQPCKHLDVTEKKQLENICQKYGLVPNPNAFWPPIQQQDRPNQNQHPDGEQTLLVQRTLRSGHRVTYPGHITILGDVNPGAEVVAGGNIIIMGTCAGSIHAGAGHKPESFVIAIGFKQAQICIADQKLYDVRNRPGQSPVCAKLGPEGVMLAKI